MNVMFELYILIYHRHHHWVALLTQISLTISRHPSLSSIAPGRSSRLHPVSAQSYCIWVLASLPAFACACAGVHWSISLMSSSLLLQECPARLVIYHHHHQVVPPARISLTLSRHFSLSLIASGSSSGLHPISSHNCCMYVLAGRPALPRPYVGITSLMSSSLLLQHCPACLARLTWIVFVMGGRWPYSWYFVGCCRQDLFNIALNILV